ALDHIGRSEEIIVSRFKQLLDEAKAESAAPSASPSESTGPVCFFQSVSMEKVVEKARGQKFSAPARVAAHPDATIQQALDRMKKTRTDLLSLRPQIETLDLRDKRFPHPIFGELNIYEWLAFIGMHEKRHLDQIVARVSQLEKEVTA
ncbi:MAG: DinB family protein, partial [Blastocatellia bacterium]